MRSSVSVILSSPTPDTNMSHPDYEQNAHDHATLLILIKQIGEEITAKTYNKLYDKIAKVTNLNIMDSNGVERNVRARYIKDYLVGNNDWGDFQTHRRLYGLITIGKCNTQIELNEVCRVHESLKVKYTSTLYDSRCIVIGVNDGPNTPSFPTPSNFKSRAIFYVSDQEVESLESQVTEFLSTLFWVLESKRHERCREKIDKVSMLFAPFERRDFVGLDMESRINRKRSLGRMTKHLGDLSLQAGLSAEALTHYQTASDILRSINDWIWLAGALEGQCAASAIIHYPNMCRSSPVKKISSLPETLPKPTQDKTAKDVDQSIPQPKSIPNLLSPEEIIRYYREAMVHYSKYQNANVIETEACYKAARLAIQHNAYLHAANFLHSVILINLALNEEEKIERLMSLSELYTRIGFQRKASFYRRLAASRYVSARNPQTNWQQCYNLMLQALPGHKLSLDPADHSPEKLEGWPGLQKQVLQDLVIAATRVGQSAVATRHMTFLLQVMWHQLTAAERHESALQLQSLAAQCEGSPVPLVLDSGLVIPPVNLVVVPSTQSFVVQNLKPHLRPSKLEKVKENFGPFLFTPINFGSLERKSTKNNNKVDYLWVADELCEVRLELSNPLPFELEVSNMRLLTSGVVFESLPLTLVLPPEASNVGVTLTGTSKEVGQLEITGYSTHTLGVKSNCRLKNIPKIGSPMFTVEVVPALPLLKVSSSLPNKTNNGARISLYAGESLECTLELENVGTLPLEWVEVTVECLQECDQVLQWDVEPLIAQLPLQPGSSTTLPLRFFGAARFLSSSSQDAASVKSSIFSTPSSFLSSTSNRPGPPDRFLTKSTTGTSSFKSGGSSLNSFSSQFSKICIENSPKALQCHLKVRFSSNPGMSAGYCRVASYVFSVEINNSVFITNWDVIPAETSNQFYLVLDIANMTSQELELKYGINKSLLMEENESCRIPIPVDRCPLTKIGKLFMAGESVNDLMEVNKLCSSHIAALVDLEWSLVSGQRHGKASLHGITLSLAMLDIVRMSPISWDVCVNGNKVEPHEELNSQVGQSLLLGFSVHNSLSWPLHDLELNIQFYQDHQNGTTNYQLDTRIACSGATSVQLEEVPEFGHAYHECIVVFLTPGQYKVNIQCMSKEKHIWKHIPPLVIQVSKS